MTEEQFKLIEEVILHNSLDKDMICCIEEMSELTKVLSKYLRNSPKFNKNKLTEELGHVLLMCNVLALRYGIKDEDILAVWQNAVDRMKENVK